MSKLMSGERISEPSTMSCRKALTALCTIVNAIPDEIAFDVTETMRGTAKSKMLTAIVSRVVSGARAEASPDNIRESDRAPSSDDETGRDATAASVSDGKAKFRSIRCVRCVKGAANP